MLRRSQRLIIVAAEVIFSENFGVSAYSNVGYAFLVFGTVMSFAKWFGGYEAIAAWPIAAWLSGFGLIALANLKENQHHD